VPIEQERQDVAARDDRVDMNRLPVQAALPSASGFFKLEPVRFASDDDFISHKIND
jgi:hypothetical protein